MVRRRTTRTSDRTLPFGSENNHTNFENQKVSNMQKNSNNPLATTQNTPLNAVHARPVLQTLARLGVPATAPIRRTRGGDLVYEAPDAEGNLVQNPLAARPKDAMGLDSLFDPVLGRTGAITPAGILRQVYRSVQPIVQAAMERQEAKWGFVDRAVWRRPDGTREPCLVVRHFGQRFIPDASVASLMDDNGQPLLRAGMRYPFVPVRSAPMSEAGLVYDPSSRFALLDVEAGMPVSDEQMRYQRLKWMLDTSMLVVEVATRSTRDGVQKVAYPVGRIADRIVMVRPPPQGLETMVREPLAPNTFFWLSPAQQEDVSVGGVYTALVNDAGRHAYIDTYDGEENAERLLALPVEDYLQQFNEWSERWVEASTRRLARRTGLDAANSITPDQMGAARAAQRVKEEALAHENAVGTAVDRRVKDLLAQAEKGGSVRLVLDQWQRQAALGGFEEDA